VYEPQQTQNLSQKISGSGAFFLSLSMKRHEKIGLDFEVDKLTNSIENIVTGDSFTTDISIISIADLKNVTKKNGWQFDWKLELNSRTKMFIS
jgi:hypothetical protein